ncbi:MAG: hypothetical protein GY711_11475 [bacterium]|nr:hypothetical protein [bacterium]
MSITFTALALVALAASAQQQPSLPCHDAALPGEYAPYTWCAPTGHPAQVWARVLPVECPSTGDLWFQSTGSPGTFGLVVLGAATAGPFVGGTCVGAPLVPAITGWFSNGHGPPPVGESFDRILNLSAPWESTTVRMQGVFWVRDSATGNVLPGRGYTEASDFRVLAS